MDNLRLYGIHDDGTIDQMVRCLRMPGSYRGVLCADGHKGYAQPVGGVIAYKDRVSISGVGFDIGCGVIGVRTDIPESHLRPEIPRVMDQIVNDISFGVGRNNTTQVDHGLFDNDTWNVPVIKNFKQMARNQLGTVGSGNHYVDILADQNGIIWVAAHFGSRGFGHKTATAFLKLAGGRDGMDIDPTLVDASSELGTDYLASMALAGEYAYAGREYVVGHIVKNILQCRVEHVVHNHHNFAWLEQHDGEQYWVVRKGATPAFPGQQGFVGGSMGDCAYVVEGVQSEESKKCLYSTIHGAGRIMSRTQAKGKKNKPGQVNREEMVKWLEQKSVVLRGGDLDEAPQAYRRLDEVIKYHIDTVKVLYTLRPLGVAMAGKDIFDPYKD